MSFTARVTDIVTWKDSSGLHFEEFWLFELEIGSNVTSKTAQKLSRHLFNSQTSISIESETGTSPKKYLSNFNYYS